MKKYLSLLLALCMSLSLAACGGKDNSAADSVEIVVFAAASMEESLNAAIEGYKAVAPEVTVVATYDSSSLLLSAASCARRRFSLSTAIIS